MAEYLVVFKKTSYNYIKVEATDSLAAIHTADFAHDNEFNEIEGASEWRFQSVGEVKSA